jgi:DNA-binding NarL/FixJ family response regulator
MRRSGRERDSALASRASVRARTRSEAHDDAVAIEAIKLGARGFVLKDVSLQQLTAGVRAVAAGGTLINPAVTERVVRGIARLATSVPAPTLPAALSKRELDVLRLIAAGQSNREIASALGTAEATVKNQASSIFGKLGDGTGPARCCAPSSSG